MLRVELTRAYSNNHTKSIASGPSETTAASVEKEAENSNVVQVKLTLLLSFYQLMSYAN